MKKGNKKSTFKEVETYRRLYQEGYSYSAIARQTGRDRTTIYYWLNKEPNKLPRIKHRKIFLPKDHPPKYIIPVVVRTPRPPRRRFKDLNEALMAVRNYNKKKPLYFLIAKKDHYEIIGRREFYYKRGILKKT